MCHQVRSEAFGVSGYIVCLTQRATRPTGTFTCWNELSLGDNPQGLRNLEIT